ncbi:MAG TPA: hypothetical protein VIJ26_02365 [Thermoanaerobaculia bacterium]
MSDFLGRLAARALGQVPPVRPRMPSRFEPAAGLAGEVVVEEAAAPPPASPPRLSRPSPRPGEERREEREAQDLTSPEVASLRGEPSLPNPSLPASPPTRRERGASKHSSTDLSLFSPAGWVEGREKRAGVMRANAPGTPT